MVTSVLTYRFTNMVEASKLSQNKFNCHKEGTAGTAQIFPYFTQLCCPSSTLRGISEKIVVEIQTDSIWRKRKELRSPPVSHDTFLVTNLLLVPL